jgi:uracil-DNA glycosylase family 4
MAIPRGHDGKPSAPIVALAEAWGRTEDAMKRPMVGQAGKLWTRWIEKAGLKRSSCYLFNVLNFRPPNNDLTRVSEEEIAKGIEEVHQTLARLDDPVVIVPMGNLALRAVLGMNGISKHRGSIYEYTDRRGRKLKVLPTIHPAATFKEGGSSDTDEGKKGRRTWKIRCQLDWHRIAADAQFKELRLPKREHYIEPTLEDVRWMLSEVQKRSDPKVGFYVKMTEDTYSCERPCLALDIETPKSRTEEIIGYTKKGVAKIKRTWGDRYVGCIGFAVDPSWSMTIPTTKAYWGSQRKLDQVVALIQEILRLPIPKATQNGLFDFFYLRQPPFNVPPTRWLYDTLPMHHIEDPSEEHSLAFQASIFLRTQFWKDDNEDKGDDAIPPDIQTWWRYCGKDGTHTRELVDVHRQIHADRGLGNLYEAHYRRQFLPLHDLMARGLPIDDERRRGRLARLTARWLTLRQRLGTLAGEDLFGDEGGVSNKKLATFLYETLSLPRQTRPDKKSGTRKVSVREVDVRRLMVKYPARMGDAGQAILDVRRTIKQTEFYSDKLVDPDGRSRCTYGWTETLRLKSRRSPLGRGRNHQNFDRECREHLIPDPGCLAMKIDMSQAESREVYGETGNEELIRLARLPSWEHDQHTTTARRIEQSLGEPEGTFTRTLGKTTNHAAQRDMKGATFADYLLKEFGMTYAPEECQRFIDAYFTGPYLDIRDVYFRRVRHQIINEKKLVMPCGFTWYCDEERLSDDLYRRGYSLAPQHIIACHLNGFGMVPMYAFLRGRHSRIVVNEHDALWISVHPSDAWDVWSFGRESLESTPIVCTNGIELTIPVGCEIGTNFAFKKGEHVEFKRPPTEDEFAEALAPLARHAA